jgi:hypothetical protein
MMSNATGLLHAEGSFTLWAKNSVSSETLSVPLCSSVIAEVMTASQIGTSGISRLPGFLTEKVNEPHEDLEDWELVARMSSELTDSGQFVFVNCQAAEEYPPQPSRQKITPLSGGSPLCNRLSRLFNSVCCWVGSSAIKIDTPPVTINIDRLVYPWAMLNSSTVERYIAVVSASVSPMYAIHEFYLSNSCTQYTFERACAVIDKHLPEALLAHAVCIPVMFTGQGLFGINHIATILIKDGALEYFDPLPIASDERSLAGEGQSLRDLLLYCQERFGLREIFERPVAIQRDTISCGVLACHFLHRRLQQSTVMGAQLLNPLTSSELLAFRRLMIAEFKQYESDHPSESYAFGSCNSF